MSKSPSTARHSRSVTVKLVSLPKRKQVLRHRSRRAKQRPVVTAISREKPFERYKRLKPWLELGNLATPVLDEGTDDASSLDEMRGPALRFIGEAVATPDFPADGMRAWFKESADKHESGKQLFQLALDVARAFLFCVGEEPEGFAFEDGPRDTSRLRNKNGLLYVETFDPYRDNFLPAIRLVELERIRRCPICRKFFFALRAKTKSDTDTSSKACSRKCNQVRRVREWRAKQSTYLQNRKFRSYGLEPERKKAVSAPQGEIEHAR